MSSEVGAARSMVGSARNRDRAAMDFISMVTGLLATLTCTQAVQFRYVLRFPPPPPRGPRDGRRPPPPPEPRGLSPPSERPPPPRGVLPPPRSGPPGPRLPLGAA